MRHSVKIKLIICGGFAVLLLLVIRLTALREDSKLLDFISKESNRPLVEFSVEQNADTVSIVLSPAEGVPRDIKIYYTLDGSVPDTSDTCYEGPLVLPAGDMSKGVIIRAAVSYKDQLSQAYTKTVLQLENGALPEDIIIVSLSTDPDNLYDYETGIMVEGKTKDDFIAAGGDYDSLQPWQLPANFKQRGDAWIRDAYAEFYDNRGNLLGGQDVGISISGGASSYLDVKSFKLSANWNRTGETADFPASWFMTAATEQTEPLAVDSYNKIIVRNGGQDRDHTFLLWNVLSPLAKESGLIHVADAIPAIVYLNGEYYSYMCLQQHINRDYLGNLHGLNKELIVDNQFGSERELLAATGLNQLLQEDIQDPAIREQVEKLWI